MSGLFESGEAEFRIGLRPIPPDRWLEGGEVEPARKAALLDTHPRAVWGETAGSRSAQAEARAMVEAAVGAAAPADGKADPAPPLWAAALRIADDLCLMERREDRWTLTAASLCSPSFFTAEQAVGRDLRALHGPVPGFEAGLLRRVERIFDALRPGLVLERRNWTVTPTDAFFLPNTRPVHDDYARLGLDQAVAALHVRMERQTLRRLPGVGAALFTIRIHRHPLSALIDRPDRLRAFAAAWEGVMSPAGEPFRRYKGLERYDPAVRALLSGRGLRPARETA